MRTPARALYLSQQGNPHGSLPATLRTPSGCSTWHTHSLQPHTHDSIGRAIIHTNSVTFCVNQKNILVVTFSQCQKSLRILRIKRRRKQKKILFQKMVERKIYKTFEFLILFILIILKTFFKQNYSKRFKDRLKTERG